jgi:hypothetical protein
LAIQIQVAELPEGLFLTTPDDLPALVAQGATVAETLEIARDVARKRIEAAGSGREFRIFHQRRARDYTRRSLNWQTGGIFATARSRGN